MDIFDIIALCGGLAFFLYGMHILSGGLEKLAGGQMQNILQRITGNRLKGLAVGLTVTAVIQSSSAVTVMLVGLVNSGIMDLSRAISVIMGSNIGTTMTAWLLSLTGIQSDNLLMQLLKPANFSPLVALVGVLLLMMTKREKKRSVGTVCVGFALLMYGMTLMSDAVAPLADMPGFVSLLTAFENPILGVLAGALFTALIQSSSASVGVLQALSLTGAITVHNAIPIILGQNIGTCISAVLALPGTRTNAKRVAVVHVLFNSIGAAIWLALWSLAGWLFDLSVANAAIDPVAIALIHSIFNISTTLLLLPTAGLLERLSCRLIKEKESSPHTFKLDQRLLTVPAVATAEANSAVVSMAHMAKKSVDLTFGLMDTFDEKIAEEIMQTEQMLDDHEDRLGAFLAALSATDVSQADSVKVAMLLHVITDLERIGDHAANLMQTTATMKEKKRLFSNSTLSELQVLIDAVKEILAHAVQAFDKGDVSLARQIEPLEQVIDSLCETIRVRGMQRIHTGEDSEAFALIDVLTDCERISDHCSNIALAVLETDGGTFDPHARLDAMTAHPSDAFRSSVAHYQRQYTLPE